MQYELSDEVKRVAGILIKDHYPDLARTKIVYLFQEKIDQKTGVPVIPQKKGKNHYGEAKLVTGLNAFLASGDDETEDDGPKPFFVILITKVTWNRMSNEHKAALVDHELMHCEYDSEADKLSMRDHDISEFTEIVKRHGVWNLDLQMFFNAAKQMPLPMAAEEQKPKVQKAAAGNGKVVDGNGHADKPAENPSASVSTLEPLKETVAKRRGRAARV